MPFMFSHVEYCDMHFVYGFCNGNALAAVEEYQRRFPDRSIPSRPVFTRIHQTLRDTGFLPSVAVRSDKNCRHTQHKLSKSYNFNIRVVIVYNMYCVTLSQNLNIRVLIVYLHFSHASDHECMLPTNVLPSTFHRETLQPT